MCDACSDEEDEMNKLFVLAIVAYILVLIVIMYRLGDGDFWNSLPWKITYWEPNIIERNVP